MRSKVIWLTLSGVLVLGSVLAQIPKGMDTVSVRKRTVLILKDTSIYFASDTTLMLPDSVARRIRNDAQSSDKFYENLRSKFAKKKVTKELFDFLFTKPKSKARVAPATPQHVLKYQEAEGKRIGSIRIKKLDVFGTSLNDTTKYSDNWLVKAANSVHVNTHGRIIRKNIFFEEGDRVDPDELRDSERFLRTLPYIKDARIIVLDEGDADLVEILIIVKDVWSISVELDYNSLTDFDFALIDNNILVFGHELRNEFLFDEEHVPKIGYDGRYRINSIGRSFITAQLEFARSEPLDRLAISAQRLFITPDIKWAGGIEVSTETREQAFAYPDTTIFFYVGQDYQEAWIGRSLAQVDLGDARSNLIFSGLYSRNDFFENPLATADTNQAYLDRHLFLASFGLTKRSYEKGSLIAAFGRTEDIPIGFTAQLLVGYEQNELYGRNYWGGKVESGTFVGRLGYFRPVIEVGGFLRGGSWEQAMIKFETTYFSNLYRYNRFHFRQFFQIGFTKGINRYTNEFIQINNEDGVRGFNDPFVRGTSKANFRFETVAFTPYYLLGFRFAIYLFADFALVNDVNKDLFKNTLYQGYGLGFRVRNDNLAINTIQLRLAYYPNPALDDSIIAVELTGQRSFPIPDLRIDKPQPLPYE